MIIDVILDRKENEEFYGRDDYNRADYEMILDYALDFEFNYFKKAKNENAVKLALIQYIVDEGYHPDFIKYVLSKKWRVLD